MWLISADWMLAFPPSLVKLRALPTGPCAMMTRSKHSSSSIESMSSSVSWRTPMKEPMGTSFASSPGGAKAIGRPVSVASEPGPKTPPQESAGLNSCPVGGGTVGAPIRT